MEEKAEGNVKWFSDEKGFGFIKQNGSDEDAFVHYSDIEEEGYATLTENDKVEFNTESTDEGVKATEVEVIQKNNKESVGEEPEIGDREHVDL